MKIARISYANTSPYFHFWNNDSFVLMSGVPRMLMQSAQKGEIIAGPLPVVDAWSMENEFEDLGHMGISVHEKCGSVLVMSDRPFAELDNVTIGLTTESSTSVMLCTVLIQQKYGHNVRMKRGLHPQDDAWLVIGDQALQMVAKPGLNPWAYVTDLATEWWQWQSLPFVFAKWIVRRDVPSYLRFSLLSLLNQSLEKGLKNLPEVALAEATRLQLPPAAMLSYLKEFTYQFGAAQAQSMQRFRDMAKNVKAFSPAQAVS